MAKKTYWEKLKDPRWQRRRLEVLERANWVCEWCMDGETTLHVHHKQYFKGKEPWEYDDDQLAALCENCHAQVTDYDILQDVISRTAMDGPFGREKLAYLIGGVIDLCMAGSKEEMNYHRAGTALRESIKRGLKE